MRRWRPGRRAELTEDEKRQVDQVLAAMVEAGEVEEVVGDDGVTRYRRVGEAES